MATIVYDDYLTSANKYLDPQKQQALKDLNALYHNQANTVTSQYDTEVGKANTAYEDQYRENAVQKLINERQVAENMANLGLTDSGLNRTQQTAVQLSYANQKGAIDRAKQAQIDALNRQKTQNLATIEQNRLAGQNEINQYYANLAAQNATEAYNTALEEDRKYREAQLQAQLEAQKQAMEYQAQQQANIPYYKFLNTSYGDNGNMQYTFETQDGKTRTFDEGINPYTGRRINGYTSKQLDKYGVWNGYQPKGVVVNGHDYGKATLADSLAVNYQGHDKNVWMTKDKDKKTPIYWVWDDTYKGGSYIRVYKRNVNGQQVWSIEV